MAKFYNYGQNNSGGSFINEMGYYVIIEAESSEEANLKFQDIGGYFNGCEKSMDCECCGDRWSAAWEDEGTELPEIYGKQHNPEGEVSINWKLPSYIYYLNGTKDTFKE